jgi:hypothetical protein
VSTELDFDVDIMAVHKANSRIEDALNRRFEKDADMYISNQDVAMIKEWLSKSEFELLYSKFSAEKYHPDVFFRTILRNAWLIKKISAEQFSNTIRPILKQVQPENSKKLLKEVAENKLDVPHSFRENLLKYYARSIDPDEAEDLLLSSHSLGFKRVKALVQRVLGQYAGTPQFISKWNSYLKQYPALGSDHYIFKEVVIEENLFEQHLEMLVEHIDSVEQPPRYFMTALANGKMEAFELVYEKVETAILKITRQPKGFRDHETYEKMKLWLLQLRMITEKIFSDKKLDEEYDEVFDQLTELYEDIYNIDKYQAGNIIRYCFKKVSNTELKNRFIEYFEDTEIHPKFKDDLVALTHGSKSQEFKDVSELMAALEQTKPSDERRLQYLSIQLSDLKNLEQQLNQLLTRVDLHNSVHANFLISLLGNRKKTSIWKKVIEYAERSPQMESILLFAVGKYVPQDSIVKTYMHRNHFQMFSELYGV